MINGQFKKLLLGAVLGAVAMYGAQMTVQLQFTGDSGGAYAPYSVDVIPASAGIETVICDDDVQGDYAPTTSINYWETPLSDVESDANDTSNLRFWSKLGSIATSVYEEGAYLAYMELTVGSGSEENAIQYAIWDLFLQGSFSNAADTSNPSSNTSGANSYQYWLCMADSGTITSSTAAFKPSTNCGDSTGNPGEASLTPTQLADIGKMVILTPQPGDSQKGQEFFATIVASPEPKTCLLFGMGLLLLSLGTLRSARKTQ